jgi:uncharacterized repeat protein (TIGR03803 family)
MKKPIAFVACLLMVDFLLHAQPVLLGMSKRGGTAQTGTIISYTVSSGNMSVLNSFEGIETSGTGKLLKGADGKLYGTLNNSRYGQGSIYSFDPITGAYTSLFDFIGSNGSNPTGLAQGTNGRLYGTTTAGGSSNSATGNGVLYSYNLQTNEFKKLVDFSGTNGAGPTGVIQMNDKLYGTTSGGGSMNKGVLFSYDLNTGVYAKLRDFDGTNGASPTGSLHLAANGLLYGMTTYGGQRNIGVIYSFNPATNAFVKLIEFEGTNGANPASYASFIQGNNGKLYGMTNSGGSYDTYGVGVVFSFDPATNECKSIKDFDVASGSRPQGDLVESGNGRLYGLTHNGGATDQGVLFSIDLQTNQYTIERDFEISTGAYPLSNLVLFDGKLYGVNSKSSIGNGDPYSAFFGNIFSFDPNPALRTYTVLKTFGFNMNGSFSSAGLMKASDGKFYGMTINGGSKGFGVLFTFDPDSKTYTKQYEFDGATGSNPHGSIVQAGNQLYGMTSTGGGSNQGVLFTFDPVTKAYQNIKDFTGTNGGNPYGSLLLVGNKLFGLTRTGGSHNLGVFFSFDLTNNSFIKLKDFDNASGANPFGNLVRANNGKLYGMTYAGGSSNLGVVFCLDPTTNAFTKLKDFDGYTGAQPYGSLILAKNGKLYGMTLRGGKTTVKGSFGSSYSNYGVLFSVDPANKNAFTVLKNFDNSNGANPNGSLMQASDDKLYGMTAGGGAYNKGVIFSLDLSGKNLYTKLKDFDGTNGANPAYGSFLTEKGNYSAAPTTHLITTKSNVERTVRAEDDRFNVSAFPNPARGAYILRIQSRSSQHLQIRILDAVGRTVEIRSNVAASVPVFLGLGYRSGVYFAEVIQGSEKVTLKLIKEK